MMSNSQWFCIRLDLFGLFIIKEVLLSVLGLGGDAKGIEVISCIQTFLLNYYFFFPLCVAGTGLTSNIFSLLWWFLYTDYSSGPYLCIMVSQIISAECGSSLSLCQMSV